MPPREKAKNLDKIFRFSGSQGLTTSQLGELLGVQPGSVANIMKRDGRFEFIRKEKGEDKFRWQGHWKFKIKEKGDDVS